MRDPGYRPARLLVTTISILLIAYAVVCVAALPRDVDFIAFMEQQMADAESGHSWVNAYIVPFGVVDVLVKLALVLLFCMWIPTANRNARALGATGMRFTPGWSVGWFFVPVLNLYKPYQVMKEIWLASVPDDARQRAPRLLGLWWALCLVSVGAGLLACGLPYGGIDKMLLAARANLLQDAVDIPLALSAMLVVIRIHFMQERRRSATVPD